MGVRVWEVQFYVYAEMAKSCRCVLSGKSFKVGNSESSSSHSFPFCTGYCLYILRVYDFGDHFLYYIGFEVQDSSTIYNLLNCMKK